MMPSVPDSERKTLRRYEVVNQPRFLTFSCYGRLPLFQNDAIKEAFVQRLAVARTRLCFRLIAWVIMPEHVHLVVVPKLPDAPMPKILSAIKRRFAEQVLRRWRGLDAPVLKRLITTKGNCRFWQTGGGYDRNVRDEAELMEKVDYMHDNPARRGLAESPTEWPWSSARWYAGERRGQLRMDTL